MRVSQPVGQKRHTNIAIVSVRKKVEGKEYKFEIACYPNKVLNQREGLETDMSQVLQTETVFTNVSRGDIATNEDLITVFETTNHLKICKQIIKEGHLQVGTKEREFMAESKTRDVLNLVSQMTMDAVSGFPLTITQLNAALDDIHYHIASKGSLSLAAKPREEEEENKMIARECVKRLETKLPHRVARVNMIIRLVASCVTADEIDALAESRCIISPQTEGGFLITCHPKMMKLFKEAFGEKIESLTVVDSFAHHVLPNCKLPEEPAVAAPVVEAPKVPERSSAYACVTCGNLQMADVASYRGHCKSTWHAYNKKRHVKGLEFIDHFDFEMLPEEQQMSFNAVDP